jgi:hypothetical protein
MNKKISHIYNIYIAYVPYFFLFSGKHLFFVIVQFINNISCKFMCTPTHLIENKFGVKQMLIHYRVNVKLVKLLKPYQSVIKMCCSLYTRFNYILEISKKCDLVYINKKYAEISKTYENLRSKLSKTNAHSLSSQCHTY